VTTSIQVADFDKISINGPYQVFIEPQQANTIALEGEQNLVENTNIEVKERVLVIAETTWLKPHQPLKVRISKSRFDALTIKGSATVDWETLSSDSFELSTTGSAVVRGAFDSLQSLKVSSFGSGAVTLRGKVEKLSASASGSTICSFEFEHLTDAKLKGSGSVQYYLKDAKGVDADLDGASRLTFGGKPSTVRSRTSGASYVQFQGN
jgi:hypothetical protein